MKKGEKTALVQWARYYNVCIYEAFGQMIEWANKTWLIKRFSKWQDLSIEIYRWRDFINYLLTPCDWAYTQTSNCDQRVNFKDASVYTHSM